MAEVKCVADRLPGAQRYSPLLNDATTAPLSSTSISLGSPLLSFCQLGVVLLLQRHSPLPPKSAAIVDGTSRSSSASSVGFEETDRSAECFVVRDMETSPAP